MKTLLIASSIAIISLALTGCSGGMASAIGQGAASHVASNAIQTTYARGMTCEEIAQDIQERSRGKINPLAIPTINREIAAKEAVAREKNCPGYEDTSVIQ